MNAIYDHIGTTYSVTRCTDPKIASQLINARAETLAEKPSFKTAFQQRRCLVPADGYYEWSGAEGRKVPFFVQRPDRGLFALAGLWEHWMGADGSELETAALMTISPNRELSDIHDRMPLIIAPADYKTWLTGTPEETARLLKPSPDGTFEYRAATIGRTAAKPPASPPKPSDQLDLF